MIIVMLLLIFLLFIIIITLYVYYKTYESFETVSDGESFINRDNSLEDITYATKCVNTILDDFNQNYNKTYILKDIFNIEKSFPEVGKTYYNISTKMHNTTDYLDKSYNIKFFVIDNKIRLVDISK